MSRKKRRIRTFSIGIYIGRHDMDIAAWFNLLRSGTSMSAAKWIHALLAADHMGMEIDIGAIQGNTVSKTTVSSPAGATPPTINNLPQSGLTRPRSVNFGSGLTSPGTTEVKTKTNDRINPAGFRSGWMVKGPDGSYIYGSVISITISTPETIELINKVWKNNREFTSYLKALIRKHLKKEAQLRAPSDAEYIRIRDAYLLYVINQQYDSRNLFLYDKAVEDPPKTKRNMNKEKKEDPSVISDSKKETPPVDLNTAEGNLSNHHAAPLRMPQEKPEEGQGIFSYPAQNIAPGGSEAQTESVEPQPGGKNPLLAYVHR